MSVLSTVDDDATKKYVNFVQRRARCMIIVCVLVTVAFAPLMLQLGSTTTDSFSAAPNTRSYDENNLVQTYFPRSFDDRETIYINCVDAKVNHTKSCAEHSFKDVFDSIGDGLSQYWQDGTLVAFTDYFNFTGDLKPLSFGYYNQTTGSMIASLEFSSSHVGDPVNNAVTKAIDIAKNWTKGSMEVYITGQTSSRLLATKAAGKMIGMADGTGMILIVILFGWQVHSWRLTLIPIFNTMMCLVIAEGLIYPLSKSGAIVLPSYVTNVCLFLSIALSVDYSFFHLSRFQEVRKEGKNFEEAVDAMVRSAGRVVLVSGVVLLFTWLALAAFPVFGTNSLGYCAAITIFVCINVNLTMNPAVISAFPEFFARAGKDGCCCCCRRRRETNEEPLTVAARDIDVTKNCFGRLAHFILKKPVLIIVPLLVYALLLPGAVRLSTADLVVGGISGGTSYTKYATEQILKDFPDSMGGVPLTVMLVAPPGGRVTSDLFFTQACALAKEVHNSIAPLGIALSDFRGPVTESGKCLSWQDANTSLNTVAIYKHFWDESVNSLNTSLLMSVSLPFDAFSDKAKELVSRSRAAVDKFSQISSGYGTPVVFHPMAVEVDAEELMKARFPWVVLVTVVVVFSVIAIRYQSVLLPFRMLFTTALPIISVLGTGVFVFQDGCLNWTGIPSLQSQGGLVWINPIACTFMLIGFALDYDIFLYSRIYADRKTGRFLEDEPAIINAVAATGPVITTAGVIMALAFSGMILQSSNPFLSQMGFTMIYGILMDTFVVRTLLVPTFLSMAGRYNWLPLKMPSKETIVSPMQETSLGEVC